MDERRRAAGNLLKGETLGATNSGICVRCSAQGGGGREMVAIQYARFSDYCNKSLIFVFRGLLEIQGPAYPDNTVKQNIDCLYLAYNLWVLLTVAAHSNSDAFFQPTILTAITVYS